MAKKSSYYNGNITENKTIVDNVDETADDSFPYDYVNNNVVQETVDKKDSQDIRITEKEIKSETKKCKVINVTSKNVFVDFCGFGVSIEVKNPQNYKKNKVIPVSYSGKIGTSDFKIWVD